MTLSDGSSLKIRPAVATDAGQILRFIRELAEFEKLSHQVVATEEQLTKNLFSEKKYAEVLLAERDGAPVAFALFFHNFSTFLGRPGIYLEDLYVSPKHRSLGIGQRLLSHLATLAEERGCGRLEWSVLDWNTNAISFYEKLGAKPLSDWIIYRIIGTALTRLASWADGPTEK